MAWFFQNGPVTGPALMGQPSRVARPIPKIERRAVYPGTRPLALQASR